MFFPMHFCISSGFDCVATIGDDDYAGRVSASYAANAPFFFAAALQKEEMNYDLQEVRQGV